MNESQLKDVSVCRRGLGITDPNVAFDPIHRQQDAWRIANRLHITTRANMHEIAASRAGSFVVIPFKLMDGNETERAHAAQRAAITILGAQVFRAIELVAGYTPEGVEA